MQLGFGGIFIYLLILCQPGEAAPSPNYQIYVLFPIEKALARFSIPNHNHI